jgi:flagellar FliL protein
MAKDGEMAATMSAAPNKGMLMIIIAVVVAVAIGAGAAMMMGGGKKKHKKADAEDMDDSIPVPAVVLKDEFIVNLMSTDGTGGHFMRVPKVELEVANENVAKKLDENRSKISDRISSTLRTKTMEDMSQAGSDIKLKEELRTVINETLEYKEGRGVLEVILPGSFIVQ